MEALKKCASGVSVVRHDRGKNRKKSLRSGCDTDRNKKSICGVIVEKVQ